MTILNYDAMAILAKRSFFNAVAETKHLSIMQTRGKLEGFVLWDKENRMYYTGADNQVRLFDTMADCHKYAEAVEKQYTRSAPEYALDRE